MKSISFVLLVVLMLLSSGSVSTAFAQKALGADKTSDQIAKMMMQHLQLNEFQYIKIKGYNQARLAQASEVTNLYSGDTSALEIRFAAIEKEFEEKLASLLSKPQLDAYATLKQKPECNVAAIMKQSSAEKAALVK